MAGFRLECMAGFVGIRTPSLGLDPGNYQALGSCDAELPPGGVFIHARNQAAARRALQGQILCTTLRDPRYHRSGAQRRTSPRAS